MPNTVIVGTTAAINITFNDDSSKAGDYEKVYYRKDKVLNVELGSSHVEIHVEAPLGYPDKFECVVSNPNTFELLVDSVDGVAPTSLSDLYDKLVTLLG